MFQAGIGEMWVILILLQLLEISIFHNTAEVVGQWLQLPFLGNKILYKIMFNIILFFFNISFFFNILILLF